MAMPWSRGKKIAAEYRDGTRDVKDLTRLFDECFRIQHEASEAAGHKIPMVVENVRGAIPWVGRSKWNFGSFHLWGDVPALMPIAKKVVKVQGFRFDGNGGSFQTASVRETGIKGVPHRTKGHWTNPAEHDGIKQGGEWWHDPDSLTVKYSSKSNARKQASAMIAKIPLTLSRHVAQVYHPCHS